MGSWSYVSFGGRRHLTRTGRRCSVWRVPFPETGRSLLHRQPPRLRLRVPCDFAGPAHLHSTTAATKTRPNTIAHPTTVGPALPAETSGSGSWTRSQSSSSTSASPFTPRLCTQTQAPIRSRNIIQNRRFSSHSPAAAMVATKLDGTAIAKGIRERLGQEIADKQKLNPRFKPTLKIIQGASACLIRLPQ